jgi:hypothetical protein
MRRSWLEFEPESFCSLSSSGTGITLQKGEVSMKRIEEGHRVPNLRFFLPTLLVRCCAIAILLAIMSIKSSAQNQISNPESSVTIPQPAVNAILSAFDKYEVVAMPAAHGLKDLDDVIFSLVRNPQFPNKVNDIEMECGNSLYQPVLDRYIAGENVPFTEVRKVWRNTTQPMCGLSGFVEQFYPLVRAINQKLPPAKRLRVLAADPRIDWDQVKTFQDILKYPDRDASIASIMEKEVLAKHRKALMLFGTFHLMHEIDDTAMSTYEKDYPNLTFVISDLGVYDTNGPVASISPFAMWPNPSIVLTKGTWLGALSLSDIFPPGIWFDRDCNVHIALVPKLQKQVQKPLEHFIDAFLYLGPQELRLKEPIPADIALDVEYIKVLRARGPLLWDKEPATMAEFNQQIINGAEHPLLSMPGPPDQKETQHALQDCLDRKKNQSSYAPHWPDSVADSFKMAFYVTDARESHTRE